MNYLKNLIEKHRYGPWKAIFLGYLILCLLSGIGSAWGNYHFVSSALLWTLTHALYLPILLGWLALSIWAGITAGRLSGLQVIGWIAGLVTAFVFIGLLQAGISHIPGIGWRFAAILDSSHDDY